MNNIDQLLWRMKGQRELAEITVSNLPEYLFESSETTFYDPAMGGGQYLQAIVNRLKKYHNIDDILPRIYGSEHSTINLNWVKRNTNLRGSNLSKTEYKNMKFNVIIGNPPYQNDKKNGGCTGSGSSALFLDFVKKSAELLKPSGIISLITPINIFTGSKDKTQYTVGSKSIYDITYIDLDVNKHFNIGQDICRWTGRLSSKDEVITEISDGRKVNLKEIDYLVEDNFLSEIVKTLTEYKSDHLILTNKGGYNFRSIESKLIKQGVDNAREISRDKSPNKTDKHLYPVDFNGKVSYVQCKPESYESPRIFVPQLTNPDRFRFTCHTNMGANGSTYVAEFDTIEEAQSVCDILNNPIYLWVVKHLRIDGRLRKTHLETLPLVDIEKVLDPTQIEYIKSKL